MLMMSFLPVGDGAMYHVLLSIIFIIFITFSADIVVATATSRMIVFYCWYRVLITIVASFSF